MRIIWLYFMLMGFIGMAHCDYVDKNYRLAAAGAFVCVVQYLIFGVK